LVCAPVPPPPVQRFDVIVSAGGGAVGAALIDAAIKAANLMPELDQWCVIAGPNLPQADFDRFTQDARPGVQAVRFRRDFTSLLAGARLSVSQAGYNTVGDILQAGCRALLVPFSAQGETEQTDRAERLAALGRAVVLPEPELCADSMAAAIRQALVQVPLLGAKALQTTGAAGVAHALRDLLTKDHGT
ncbi:MAG: glycosyltransferase, partial [Paracoccaceae bacterium]|nr:glycosyltransferase [Paracoccaceae bacterium]